MTQALMSQAIEAIRRGDKAAGQRLLAQVLRADPRSETAWLWMSQIVETDAQRLDCLRRMLAINPNNATARRGIELLETRMGSKPPLPETRIPPPAPAPPELQTYTTPDAAPIFTSPIAETPPDKDIALVMAEPGEASAPVETREKKLDRPARQRETKTVEPAHRLPLLPIVLVVILLLAAGGIFLALSSRPNAPATPGKVTKRLATSIVQDGDAEIVLVQSDGSGVTRLTNRKGVDIDPIWSPDGTRIAFAAEYTGTFDIAVVDANGQGYAQLTLDAGQGYTSVDPAWSPDGSRITFASDRDGDFDIFVMRADGAIPFNLTRSEGDDRSPGWSPDGQSIVFQSDREGPPGIYRMSIDGSGLTLLTGEPAGDTEPAISPDGQLIAFVSTRGGDADIYVMGIDGSDLRAVTDNSVEDRAPSWTPDSSILFTSVPPDGAALFTVQPDGAGLTRLWEGAPATESAVWQPAEVDPATLTARAAPTPTAAPRLFALPPGTLVFASNREGEFELYSMSMDGSNLQRLTSAPGRKAHPSLSPVEQRLAYDAPLSVTQTIFAVDIGGTQPLTLTGGSGLVTTRPIWSPDGARIAYQAAAERGDDIWVMNTDGSGAAQITNQPGFDGCLSWQPDGKRIAFTSDRDGNPDIYVMNADGSDVQALTQHHAADRCPTWGPDGQLIAFLSDRDGAGVYLMAPDGSGARLVAAIADASQPDWSPDGKFLLVSSDQTGNSELYVISVDGAAIRNITHTPTIDEVDPVWKP